MRLSSVSMRSLSGQKSGWPSWGLLVPQVVMICQWGVNGTRVCWSWSGWLGGYLCAMINIVIYRVVVVVVVKVMQVMENDTKHDVCLVTFV